MGPLFWLQLSRVAVALPYHKDIFSQEEALLGSLVHPKCFFEVLDVWGSGVPSAWLPKKGPGTRTSLMLGGVGGGDATREGPLQG